MRILLQTLILLFFFSAQALKADGVTMVLNPKAATLEEVAAHKKPYTIVPTLSIGFFPADSKAKDMSHASYESQKGWAEKNTCAKEANDSFLKVVSAPSQVRLQALDKFQTILGLIKDALAKIKFNGDIGKVAETHKDKKPNVVALAFIDEVSKCEVENSQLIVSATLDLPNGWYQSNYTSRNKNVDIKFQCKESAKAARPAVAVPKGMTIEFTVSGAGIPSDDLCTFDYSFTEGKIANAVGLFNQTSRKSIEDALSLLNDLATQAAAK